ncbi:MAG: family transporter [Bacteroidetes bacterium]|nr:family transporter [Bacteroidota bacterium]
MKEGFAGKIAGGFLQSKLSLLLMVAFMLIGVYSVYLIPREEEPQIEVPAADIFIGMPGATPAEMETKVVAPLEKALSNVNGVEHVMSTSMSDQAMLTVQFYVGKNQEKSLVNLYNELIKNMDKMPQGVSMPLIKTRSINDVPVLALTLWSKSSSDYMLRQQAELLRNEIKKIKNVTNIDIIGGRSREVSVTIDKDKLAGMNLDLAAISQYMQAANFQMQAGNIYSGNETYSVSSGNFLKTREDVDNLIVGMNEGHPIYLSSIATITEGPSSTPIQYVSFGYGADAAKDLKENNASDYTAVTIAISKQEGTDAMHLSEKILDKVEHLKKESVSPDINISVTRNYGESASEKVSELLLHLFGAIVAVTLFVMLAMGWRGGLVVFLSVPVTFALTLFAYYFMDYTLNRITLFALVFVTGIVVDDSIIIAENMHRHFKMKYLSLRQAAIFAINEVGNPTILATLTVIAAVLPMAFVSGLMGPYMSPMPIGASIAMTFSLIVALTLTPYLGYIFLKHKDSKKEGEKEEKEYDASSSAFYRYYAWFMNPMLASRKKRWVFMLVTLALLIGSVSLFFFKVVPVKMLPFDNKNEFQVVIDMPESATLEQTDAVTKEIAAFVATQPEVVNYQTYVGTSAPISFNGLMRHYDLRKGENVADIQVNLTDKGDRKIQSHDIAKKMRKPIQEIALRWNANAKIVEVPPGPPVLSTIVAEVYGPNYEEQIKVARQIKNILSQTEGIVDTDVLIEDDQQALRFAVDKEKAMLRGVAPAKVTENLRAAISGKDVGVLHKENSLSPIPIRLEMNNSDKSSVEALKSLPIQSMSGQVVQLGDIAEVKEEVKEKSIWRKDQKRLVMVTADLAGALESPVYAMMDVNKKLKEVKLPEGYELSVLSNSQPENEDNYSMKWDGEWQITYEVFRDLGIAFAIAILIIYLLIVGWFQNFLVPIVMLAAIPLSLIGIVLGHWIMGAYFSATSMIGFIALAGVMVRNSVLLIDFINIRLKEGIPLKQAILEAGAVRTLPILLTAGTVVLGAIVILFDPLFQGLAISLMGGTITSTILTLGVVPLLYFKMLRKTIK